MNMQWPLIGLGNQGWTAVDAADGDVYAVSVRTSRHSSGKPQVVRCAHGSGQMGMAPALAEVAHKLGSAQYPCTLALTRGDYQIMVLPEPPVLESEMLSNLRWTLTSMIDFPIEEANIAWMRIPTAEYQPTQDKQVYAIVARNSLVAEWAGWFEKAKLGLKAVDVRETALRNVAVLLEKKAEGLGLLTIGPSGVTTTFTYRGELYLDRFIAQPMEEVMEGDTQRRQKFLDRVSQQVAQSMELLTRTHPFITVNRIVVGPWAERIDLAAHLAGKVQVPVEQLDLVSIFDFSAVPQLMKTENQSRYLVALGAALRGMRKTS